ncbi:hypothetical protein ElyMa_002214200, partial [Elysia marginata]
MATSFKPYDYKIHADSFRMWPWILLLVLSGVTWFLPLSPAINTLESKSRPSFFAPLTEKAKEFNSSHTDNVLQKALKTAGCENGKSVFGQDCGLLEKAMAQMNIELSDLGIKGKEKEESDDISWN